MWYDYWGQISEFQRVLERESKEPEALIGMAETYFHALDHEKGSELLG